jgi:Protein of unknown function (DUF3253)
MSPLRHHLLERLAQLSPYTTMCPGKLARDCGTTLAKAREDILTLARAGKIKLTQRGKPVPGNEPKGPFRVSLAPKVNV